MTWVVPTRRRVSLARMKKNLMGMMAGGEGQTAAIPWAFVPQALSVVCLAVNGRERAIRRGALTPLAAHRQHGAQHAVFEQDLVGHGG